MIHGIPVYWLLYTMGGIQLLATLRYIRRLREWHHGYLALMLGVLPWWWARVAALTILADDLYQHTAQQRDRLNGFPMRPDFSPLHRLYVALYRLVFRG